MRRTFRGGLVLAAALLLMMVPANANIVLNFDENGNGSINTGSGL